MEVNTIERLYSGKLKTMLSSVTGPRYGETPATPSST